MNTYLANPAFHSIPTHFLTCCGLHTSVGCHGKGRLLHPLSPGSRTHHSWGDCVAQHPCSDLAGLRHHRAQDPSHKYCLVWGGMLAWLFSSLRSASSTSAFSMHHLVSCSSLIGDFCLNCCVAHSAVSTTLHDPASACAGLCTTSLSANIKPTCLWKIRRKTLYLAFSSLLQKESIPPLI